MKAADSAEWLRRNLDGIEAWLRLIASSSPDAELIERDGVTALLNRAAPERSVFNSVVARRAEALTGNRDELARIYAEKGCAWTVWIPEGDRDAAALLAAAGHTLDAEPRAMGMDLAAVEAPDFGDFEWTTAGSTELMCSINDRAYGYDDGTWLRGMGTGDVGRTYFATFDGQSLSTATAVDADGDCLITCVATVPESRGQGLAGRLIQRALVDARERGCTTTTLQATKAGAPVYERIGYRDFGVLQMWELRPRELAGA